MILNLSEDEGFDEENKMILNLSEDEGDPLGLNV